MAGLVAVLAGAYRLSQLRIAGWHKKIDWKWIATGLKVSIPFLVATLAIRGVFTLDRYWLQSLGGLEILGAYVLFMGISGTLMAFLDAGVFAFSYPGLISAYQKKQPDLFYKNVRTLFVQTGILSVAFAVVSLLLLSPLLNWLGKPMIAWSIEAALNSGCFDQVVVSTDDAEIAEIARQCGAQVPFMRPAVLSDDHTGTTTVVAHAINWFRAQGQTPEQVCCLYATAPFVSVDDLRRGLTVLSETACDYAFSVTSYAFPIQRAIRINEAGRVDMFNPEYFNTRSQDLEDAYHDAGQFYWGHANAWPEEKMIFSPASKPVLLPRHRVQDIDTPEDWVRAEWLFKAM